MNRIILIGNGFDRAHGMETSYNHFIDDYWKNCVKEYNDQKSGIKYENEEIIIRKIRDSKPVKANSYVEFKAALSLQQINIGYTNVFFRTIMDKCNGENWVDIEIEYYYLLKTLKTRHEIKKLNAEFEKIKSKLIKYLIKIESEFKNKYNPTVSETIKIIGCKIYEWFNLKDFSESSFNKKAEIELEMIEKDRRAISEGNIKQGDLSEHKKNLIERIKENKEPLKKIKEILNSNGAINYFDLYPNEVLFLNFNYTSTNELYKNSERFQLITERGIIETKSIHIHGALENAKNNPIIFGFGDELDDDYKLIEMLNINEVLENIKSIRYSDANNFKKLLRCLNSNNFQVYIFGHSCGLSDRTLLNTIFEHENCASIKIFYHQKSDVIDNYSDIVSNIYRNFNDKAKMRDRVVNKKYCEKLR